MKKLLLPLLLASALAAPAAAPPPVGMPADDAPAKKTEVDEAIDKALEFLAATQEKTDGSWKLGASKSPAVTSLAVMAFLSAGHVPGEGKYGEIIEKGVRWVLKAQQPNGIFSDAGNYEMYNHGICTLMVAEVCGMTDGKLAEELRPKLVKAVEIILKAQRPPTAGNAAGGWRYHVQNVNNEGSDISVTGWQIMALRASKNLGCDVPAEVIDNAVAFIKRCQDKGSGGFRYTPSDGLTIPCTGTSILALELCGKDTHRSPEVLQAGAYLIKDDNLPRWGRGRFFFYSLYYCSQATFQLGGNYREVFRPKLYDVLLKNQRNNGSWIGGASDDAALGPNYCTAMGVLALTVEYRFLPIYQRDEESAKDK